jgi:NDP-sugar pyrophosphorylase family protein
MPELFKILANTNRETTVYPIREHWMDIGRISDLEIANAEYHKLFA